jgi:phage head maturation protease
MSELKPICKRVAAPDAEVQTEERAIRFVASDGSVDRYGDVIEPNGWDLKHFRNNPVLLWMHDHSFGALGLIDVHGAHALHVRDGQLRARARFEKDNLAEPLQKLKLWEQVQAGLLRGFSISARPLVDPEPIMNGKGIRTGGVRYPKVELLEISLVTVPANPNALAIARSFGVAEQDLGYVYEGGASAGYLKAYYDLRRADIPGAFTPPRQA